MKKEYKILLGVSLIANFADNLIGPFYAVFVEKIGGSILDIGYTIAIFAISTGLLMIIIGKISDKINKEIVVIIGYSFYALGSIGYLLISNSWQLFILQIIFALGTACLSAPLTTLFTKFIQKGKEGEQWGLENGGTYIMVGFSVLLGTLIINFFSFKVLFLTMFVIQLIAVIIQIKFYFMNKI